MNSKERLLDKITTIVRNENRPVSYLDLISFEYNGKMVNYKHGTLRNLISKLLKEGRIYTVCRSPQAFYSLPGIRFGNKMTPIYMVGIPNLTNKQEAFLKFFKIHKLQYPVIHDVRLTFVYKGLRSILLNTGCDFIDTIDEKYNKDITLKDMTVDDITLKTTIHYTDNITVMISCSYDPMPIDHIGIAKLSSILTRVEVRLQSMIDNYYKVNLNSSDTENIEKIPTHMNWIVTMWHFGFDSELEFTGELFTHTWKEGLEVFKIYSKKRSELMEVR